MVGIVPTAAHAPGVQVPSDHVSGVLTQADAESIDRFHRPFDPTALDALQQLIAIIDRQVQRARQRGQPLIGVGVAVPGTVDPVTGTLGWNGTHWPVCCGPHSACRCWWTTTSAR
jgi:predicted NBD/HSP70 family sugar kinase